MTIGSKVTAIHMPHLGVGEITDVRHDGLLRIQFADYTDWFHALEVENAVRPACEPELPFQPR